MQRPDDQKRRAILRSASELFVRRPFHEVLLDDIAADAKVGKGTLYVYFDSKEHLFLEAITDGLDQLMADLKQVSVDSSRPSWETIAEMVRRLSDWTMRHPQAFELLRTGNFAAGAHALRRRRRMLGELFESALRRAVETGELVDPNPELTAQFIPAMARAGALWGTRALKADDLCGHILHMLKPGFGKGGR